MKPESQTTKLDIPTLSRRSGEFRHPDAPEGYYVRPKTYRVDREYGTRGGWRLRQYRGKELVFEGWLGTQGNLVAEVWATENRGFQKQEGSL
jgi:hypothetical protein